MHIFILSVILCDIFNIETGDLYNLESVCGQVYNSHINKAYLLLDYFTTYIFVLLTWHMDLSGLNLSSSTVLFIQLSWVLDVHSISYYFWTVGITWKFSLKYQLVQQDHSNVFLIIIFEVIFLWVVYIEVVPIYHTHVQTLQPTQNCQ